ncbi:ankyrin repeat domain-containing protein [Chitinophaga sp. HK235]|uniref:ankyrin repeat domain-containing protein n=1 Tax=Chitinophaga sp. HK235 TaxID=2952571 RepID=UPI001BA7A8A6|nr:ankyrin repeat domain-containing protein [Chitinophaga sp. HK235]
MVVEDCKMNFKYSDVDKAIDERNFKILEEINLISPATLREAYNGDYASPIHYAAKFGDAEVLNFFHTIGLDLTIEDANGINALDAASSGNNIKTAKWLLEKGGSIEGGAKAIISPLMSAVMLGHLEMVKFLIENGADVNRVHVRTGKLPLDAARSRKYDEIAALLTQHGARSYSTLPDWIENDIKGSGILSHVTLRLGEILPVDIPTPIDIKPVVLKLVQTNGDKNRVLFTFGLFDFHKPMLEFFLVLPQYWNFYNKEDGNQFPVLFLSKLINHIKSGWSVKEGDCLLAEDRMFNDLKWPEGIAGLFISDVKWKSGKSTEELNKDIEESEQVKLFTLIPLKAIKGGYAKLSIEKGRESGWTKLTVPIEG